MKHNDFTGRFDTCYHVIGDFNMIEKREKNQTQTGLSLCKKAIIHQVTTILATSKNVLFPDHNHLLTPGADHPSIHLSHSCLGNNKSVSVQCWFKHSLFYGNKLCLNEYYCNQMRCHFR